MAVKSLLTVCVIYSPSARQVHEVSLMLDPGSTVAQALSVSGLLQRFPEIDQRPRAIGVWGQKANPQQVLQDGDRVEIYRPLLIDPKAARRLRFAKQGARGVGLFRKQRPGINSAD